MFMVDCGGATPFEPTSPGPLPYGALADDVVASDGSLRTNRPTFFFGSSSDVVVVASSPSPDEAARFIQTPRPLRRVGTSTRRVPTDAIRATPRAVVVAPEMTMDVIRPSVRESGWFRRRRRRRRASRCRVPRVCFGHMDGWM